MLNQLTPLILTYNEAPNIGRVLERLSWAREVVVVDSISTDATLEIIAGFSNARVVQRKFDSHCNQWNFGLKETGIDSEWVLALDADYMLTPELIEELRTLEPDPTTNGYRVRFVYCINGQPLKGSAYPPGVVLYRREHARYVQDGHTQRVEVDGLVRDLQSSILHDDRKPLAHWVQAQSRYMKLEADKLLESRFRELGWADRLRKARLFAPFVMFIYCLFFKGTILNGRIGLFYAMQRSFAEFLLSLYLIENDLNLKERCSKVQAPANVQSPKSNVQGPPRILPR